MQDKYAIILCAILGALFGGIFWWLTSGSTHHMWVMRIGFTISLTLLGIGIGCFIQILSLGDTNAK